MKKRIIALVLCIVALTLALSACNNTKVTISQRRWETEHHVFNISLARAEDAGNYVKVNGTTYARSFPLAKEGDEIVPIDVDGTLVYDIAENNDGTAVFTTEQNLVALYATEEVEPLLAKMTADQKAKLVVEPTSQDYPFQVTEGVVALRSTTVTSVRFKNDSTQHPLVSSKIVDGYYVGNIAQELSHFDETATYNYVAKDNSYEVTITNGDGETKKMTIAKTARFVDVAQILMYVRGFEKAVDNFQDAGTATTVCQPFELSTQTATFSFQHQYNSVLQNGEETVCTKLNGIQVSIGGVAYMFQQNLPDTLKEKNLDTIIIETEKVCKYTTVRFQVGHFAYELAEHDQTILDEIKIIEQAQ